MLILRNFDLRSTSKRLVAGKEYSAVLTIYERRSEMILTRPISNNFIIYRLNTKHPVEQHVPLLGTYVAAISLRASGWLHWTILDGCCDRGQLKCDGTRPETRFRLSAKRTSPFKSAVGGRQFSRLLAAEVCGISGSNAGYTMFRGSVKGTGYPLHSPVSPSLPLLCTTVCHHISTGVYTYRCT